MKLSPSLRKLLFDAALFGEKMANNEAMRAHQLLDRADNLDKSGILALRDEAFNNLISFVFEHSPFYKRFAIENGYTSRDFTSIKAIDKLPLITKDILKGRRKELVTDAIPDSECIQRNSGGTTGEPVSILVDKQTRTNDLYFYYRGLRNMGWKPGYPMVKLFGGSLSGNNAPTLKNKIKKFVAGEYFLPAFDLNKDTAPQYLGLLRDVGPCFLQGYVSSVYNIAWLVRELNFKGIKVLGAFTTAEQLPLEQADFIKEVLHCDVKGFYGCAEINCLGFQETMNGTYVTPDEIVFIENSLHPELNIQNAFLLTSLFNRKTPLIRYLNGDSGILGQNHPKYSTIDELSGRTADMFIKPDGSYISSIVATQTMQITGLTHKVRKYQLWQTAPDKVEILYIPFYDSEDLSDAEKEKIVDMYGRRLGHEFNIVMYKSDKFIKSSSGKHRLMINKYSLGL